MRDALSGTAAVLALLVATASASAQQKNEGMGLLATPSQGTAGSNPAFGLEKPEEMRRLEEQQRRAEEMRRQRQLAEEQRRRQMEAEAAAKRQPK
ncbi:MAG: hypothetical protein ABWY47_11540 [Xanthobacteraceae bacterium]|jgi:hypothetical protein